MNVFVIMPFDAEFDKVYRDLIKKPLQVKGHNVSRADDVETHQNILAAIIKSISEANLVVADLTESNPNVYYELGVAHALGIPTIQIVRDLAEVPFDLKGHYIETYSLMYDEAHELQQAILDKLDREPGNEYNFSNPVHDALRPHKKIIIQAEPVTPQMDREAATTRESDSASEDGELGMLDAIVEAEESAQAIGEVAAELTEELNKLSEGAQSHSAKLNELNANPNQSGINSKRLQVARRMANDLNGFAATVEKALPRFDGAWTKLDEGLGHYLSSYSIENASQLEEISSLICAMEDTRNNINYSKGSFEHFQEVLKPLSGVSRVTDRGLKNMDRSLGKLIDKFDVGDSTIARMIVVARGIIAQYDDGEIDNGMADDDDNDDDVDSDDPLAEPAY